MAISIEAPQALPAKTLQLPFLASLVWLSMLGAIIANVQPMFLGGLANSFNLNAQQLGFLGGAELAGSCLASLCAAFWFPLLNLRRVAMFALAVTVCGNFMTSWVANYLPLLCLRFVTAFFGAGVIYSLTLGLIGQVKNPDRIIALAIILQVLSLAVGMATIPLLLEHWQLPGMMMTLSLLMATGFLLLPFIPHRAPPQEASDGLSPAKGAAWFMPAALLLSLVMFSIGLGAIWAFLERMGASAGFAMADIGKALAVSGFIGGLGALSAALLGQRIGRLLPLTVGIVGQLGVCWLLSDRTTWPLYIIAVALFNFFWNLVLPFLMGAIGTADKTGRFMVLIPAAQAGGYAIGPMLAGVFIVGEAYTTASLVSLVAFIVCLVMVVPLVARLNKSTS